MSWQAYIDTSLIGSGMLDKAFILSAAGDSIWAQSSGFTPKPDEMKALVALFHEPAKAFGSGFKIRGEKYMTIRADARSLYGKKGKEGILCVKTNQCVLVGHHNENVQLQAAAPTIEQLADYLIGLGY